MGDRALHVDVDAQGDRLVLERADHLEAGPVTDMGEPRMGVAAERSLQDPAVARAVEHGPPALQLVDPGRGLLGVQLGHARLVEQLAADHRVAEVDLPRVGLGDVPQRGGDAALGHDRVRLAEQRLADEADARTGRASFDGGSQTGTARADHEDVVGMRFGRRTRHAPAALEVDRGIGDDPERQEPNVEVGQHNREEADPGPPHVVAG